MANSRKELFQSPKVNARVLKSTIDGRENYHYRGLFLDYNLDINTTSAALEQHIKIVNRNGANNIFQVISKSDEFFLMQGDVLKKLTGQYHFVVLVIEGKPCLRVGSCSHVFLAEKDADKNRKGEYLNQNIKSLADLKLEKVIAAGEIFFSDSVITKITDVSGGFFYIPTDQDEAEILHNYFLKILSRVGLPISKVNFTFACQCPSHDLTSPKHAKSPFFTPKTLMRNVNGDVDSKHSNDVQKNSRSP